MSLKIYMAKSDIPEEVRLIEINDTFFDVMTSLSDTPLVRKILSEIDNAQYASPLTFVGRNPEWGQLNKSMLSTGAKTLLNIIGHPDKCFNVCECGNNALQLIPEIKAGNIYWQDPIVAYAGDGECDIVLHGKHYTDFFELLQETMD